MLDLDSNEQEVDLAHDHVFEMVFGLVVLEFNVQAILDADFHLDRVVGIWRHAVRVNPEVLVFGHVCHSTRYRHSNVVSAGTRSSIFEQQ
jgi:hypothetical protein